MLSRSNTSSLCATSCVLMHVSYYYYTRKFVAQCEVGEQCRVQANRLKRTAPRLPHCRGVTRLFLNGGSCCRGSDGVSCPQ